jgi:hypothetical protein
MKLIEEKNEIINKLLRIKKNKVTKEEYYNLRDFWNNKREETSRRAELKNIWNNIFWDFSRQKLG